MYVIEILLIKKDRYMPLNVITLGGTITDNINKIITLTSKYLLI